MKKILMALMLLISQACLAGPGYLFNVAVNGSSLGITSTVNHTYPNAGIKITSPGYTLANAGTECRPNANGYCLFSVNQSTPATITVKGSGSLNVILCLNGAGPASCQNYDNLAVARIAKSAYVTASAGTPAISFCPINQTTGALQNCQDAGGESVLAGISPQGIVLNTQGTTAYISSRSGQPYVYQCSINATGTFNNCAAINIVTPTGYHPNRGQITLNAANTIAYLIDLNPSFSPRVLACPIVSGSLSGNCSDTGATNIDNYAAEIVLNSAGTTAYIGAENTAAVTVCNVNGTSFSGCTLKTGGGGVTFNEPDGVALNNTETILYVADHATGNVYGCSTTPNGGSTFNNCFVASSSITQAWSITLNATNTFAYVSDYNTTLYSCPINNNGTFGTCSTIALPEPSGITLGY